MNVSIESNIKSVLSEFRTLEGVGVPYAIKEALNDTLFELRKEMPGEIGRVFDRPTVFTKTLSAWEVEKANTKALVGALKMKPAQAAYMQWQVFGGTQTPKKRAIPMPELQGGGRLVSASGGLKKNWRVVFGDKRKYFSGIPKGAKVEIGGVYQRTVKTKWDKKKKRHTGQIKLLLTWESQTKYREKWRFHYFASEAFYSRFPANFRKRIQSQLDFRAAQAAKLSG
jgi:hypothetical protein